MKKNAYKARQVLVDQIKKMYKTGLTTREIAKATGKSRTWVSWAINGKLDYVDNSR